AVMHSGVFDDHDNAVKARLSACDAQAGNPVFVTTNGHELTLILMKCKLANEKGCECALA
ncbi:MAG: hypothetical protein PHG30_07855, partial [Eubacteriales bacterium]|nr:hypothetical protein [Eubacteriales bacterium]